MMTTDGMIDGSWELNISITDLQMEKRLRVKGDRHIGGVMLDLVEGFYDLGKDWSDYALWWPDKKLWLTRTRFTLDQYGVQADAQLLFTPMHKTLRIQLPDLQILDLSVNFSINVFSAVVKICRELRVRHPEELSIFRKLDSDELKKNKGVSATRRTQPPGLLTPNGHHSHSYNNLDSGTLGGSPFRSPMTSSTPQGTLLRGGYQGTPGHSPNSPMLFNANGTMSPGSAHSLAYDGAVESVLANSPILPTKEALRHLYRPKNLSEKARINAGWLDSSRSLLEQGIDEGDLVLLRYKFYNFYELNIKYDLVRINQIYEQSKWMLISEELSCTEEEMIMFAALQLQIQLQSGLPQPELDMADGKDKDEVDMALTELQVSLEGSKLSSPGDITRIPELTDYMKFFKPKRFGLRSFKRGFFVFKDTHLSVFKRAEDVGQEAQFKANLRGCEVTPDINVTAKKFNIKLFIARHDGMTELWLKTDTEEQYARWMAAFRLAAKGRTMADSSYESEVQSILAFLSMQHPAPAPAIDVTDLNFLAENYVAPIFLRKSGSRQLSQRILEAHANVREMNLMDAKMSYIKAWQSLPEYGISYFIIRVKDSRKEELLGVTFNRLLRMDLHSGDTIKTYRFQNMKTWSVNWKIMQVNLEFENEKLAFQCLTADCKVVHEYIGGYIFLSMRSGDKNQTLNEELFHKLTGGVAID